MGEPDLHEKADETLALLMRAFAEVLDTLGEGSVAAALPAWASSRC